MKTRKLAVILIAALGVAALSPRRDAKADATTQPSTRPAPSAQLEKSASGRADSIVEKLGIDDPAKAARVHDILAGQFIALHDWHQANDAQVKKLSKAGGGPELDSIEATRHALHNAFLAKLSTELTPDQILEKGEIIPVKDYYLVRVKPTEESYKDRMDKPIKMLCPSAEYVAIYNGPTPVS